LPFIVNALLELVKPIAQGLSLQSLLLSFSTPGGPPAADLSDPPLPKLHEELLAKADDAENSEAQPRPQAAKKPCLSASQATGPAFLRFNRRFNRALNGSLESLPSFFAFRFVK
jgi:hypothetical protein